MTDFDTFSDLLSEGSNDSFFDEPKNAQKAKPSESKQNVTDLFNLSGNPPKGEEKTTLRSNDSDWLGLNNDLDDDPLEKIANKRDNEIINSSSNADEKHIFDNKSKVEPKSTKKIITDLFGNSNKEANQSASFFDDILTDIKQKKNVDVAKDTGTVEILPVKDRQPRVPRSGIIDPLGLFSEDTKTKVAQEQEVKRKRDVSVTFLEPAANISKDSLESKTISNPSTAVPNWLETNKSGSKLDIKAGPSTTDSFQHGTDYTSEYASETAKLEEVDSDLTLQQHLASTQLQYQNTSLALQQQEHQVLMTLQLKKYEDSMTEMRKHQQHILERQESQFNGLVERQLAKQQIMENQLRAQQDRINNHIQMLLSQSGGIERTFQADGGAGDGTSDSLIATLKKRQQDETNIVEEFYKKQIALLEDLLSSTEARYKIERTAQSENYETKIKNLEESHHSDVIKYKQKLEEINEQHAEEIKSLRDIHSRIVDEIKHEYSTLIESLKLAKREESVVLGNSDSYVSKLENSLLLLHNNSKELTEISQRVETDRNILSVTREESLKAKEEEVKLTKLTLEKAREAADSERTQLLGLVRTLETKIAQQAHDGQEERWALQLAAATVASRGAALDREMEFNRNLLEREREQLKNMKESILAEQESSMLQITEEKMKVQTERLKLETALKLNKNSSKKTSRAEIEAAIQVAKEAAELTDIEREKLCQQQQEVERLKRTLKDRENKVNQKESEFAILAQNAEIRSAEGEKALKNAKLLELKYNEKLKDIQSQFALLRERERKVAAEKIALSRERISLYSQLQKKQKCSLCTVNEDPSSHNFEVYNNLEIVSQDIPEFVDTDLLRFQLELTGQDQEH